MQVLGIVGGIASGKTLVSEVFGELGAVVLSGDRIAHEVLCEPAVLAAARDRWGDLVLDERGQVDRSQLAAIVFGETPTAREELGFLENLTHPQVHKRIRQALEQLREEEEVGVVLLDVALLLKTDWHPLCEKIIFLDTPLKKRQEYAVRRGWDAGQLARREACQLPLKSKRSQADFVLHNSGDLVRLREEIRRVWDSLLRPQMPH